MVFPVQNSTLSSEALARFLSRRYHLPGSVECRFWRKGMADTYRVSAGGRGFYLKVHSSTRRSRKDVEEEVRLLLHLLKEGVEVCEPIASAGGEYTQTLAAPEGDRHAVLYKAVEGEEGTTEAHRRAFGAMVARLHAAADKMEPAYDRDYLELDHVLDANLAAIRTLMSRRRDDLGIIEGIADRAREAVTTLLAPRHPEHGPCHGDLHGGDVLYAPDGSPVIFDFESSGTGWRALDLAVFGGSVDWMDTTEQGRAKRQREVGEFIEGYSSVRELTKGELVVLRHGAAVHHIHLMGLTLRFWTNRDGWYWADDGYIDWHMKWFRYWYEHPEA